MHSKAEITEKVVAIVAEKGNVAPAQVVPQTHLINDLNFDSLEVVELMMQLEDLFDISVPDEEAQKLLTVGALVDAIVQHCAVERPARS
jgi:acyl carrier protein